MKKTRLISILTALFLSVSILICGCNSTGSQNVPESSDISQEQTASDDAITTASENETTTVNEQTTVSEEKTSAEESTASDETQTAASEEKPDETKEQTATTEKQTSATEKETAATEKQTTATEKQTTATEKQTSATEKEPAAPSVTHNKSDGVKEIRDMTTMEIVHDMGQGINLGNTMESCGNWISPSGGVRGYETAWGSPVITEKVIQGYADCGFGVLRIPVAWSNMMGENYTINEEYTARVKEIVDWTLDSGMYAIVNIHWDNGWFSNFPTDTEECMKKYTRIWEQISEAFKDYGDKLMFESLNEEGGWDSMWNRYSGNTNGKADSYELLYEINQRFVDTVRNSGGNNAKRHLLIAGYNTDIDLTCDEMFKMPNDPAGRCAVSVHYYTPSTFCILEEDASWGKAKSTWGNEKDIKELQKYMNMLKETFVDKGIPVIVGEYGVAQKNKTEEQIVNFMETVTEEMYNAGVCPVIWDIQGAFYNRMSYKFLFPEMLESIMASKEAHR